MFEYATATSHTINFEKSSVTFSRNVDLVSRACVEEVLWVRKGHSNNKYLGLPSLIGRNKKEILGFIKRRITTRIHNWNARFLSMAGREVLLNNVVQALPTFTMSVFLLPKELCYDIERLMNAY